MVGKASAGSSLPESRLGFGGEAPATNDVVLDESELDCGHTNSARVS